MKRLFAFCLLPLTFCLISILVSCQSEAEIEYQRYFIMGRNIYKTHCTNCHSETGAGLGELYPPLKEADYLRKNKTKLACNIQNGLQGLIVVNGQFYNQKMPSQAQLSPIEIAEVITFITNSFGNKQGIYKVDNVNADLKNCGL